MPWRRRTGLHCMWLVWNNDWDEGLHQYLCDQEPGEMARVVCEVDVDGKTCMCDIHIYIRGLFEKCSLSVGRSKVRDMKLCTCLYFWTSP